MPLRDRLAFHSQAAPNGCREWTGSTDGRHGYGKLRWKGTMRYAHILAWEEDHGTQVPEGLEVRHTCDNPPCIERAHLKIGTHGDNIGDAVERGRCSGLRRADRSNASRLTWGTVRGMREAHANGMGNAAVARKFGVSDDWTRAILKNRKWIEEGEPKQ